MGHDDESETIYSGQIIIRFPLFCSFIKFVVVVLLNLVSFNAVYVPQCMLIIILQEFYLAISLLSFI